MTEWRVSEEDGHVYQHDGPDRWPPPRRVVTVYSPNRRDRAHLIAAAPDLLEALDNALAMIDDLRQSDERWTTRVEDWESHMDLYADARAAIAKAKGESQ